MILFFFLVFASFLVRVAKDGIRLGKYSCIFCSRPVSIYSKWCTVSQKPHRVTCTKTARLIEKQDHVSDTCDVHSKYSHTHMVKKSTNKRPEMG